MGGGDWEGEQGCDGKGLERIGYGGGWLFCNKTDFSQQACVKFSN